MSGGNRKVEHDNERSGECSEGRKEEKVRSIGDE